MTASLIESLLLPHRLALAYAPRQTRDATLALLALDARLARIVGTGGEAMLAQIKLAWWRERLGEAPANWPKGEPLLALLAGSGLVPEKLSPLVDGWEALLGEQPDVATFVEGRAQAWAALDGKALQPAREWALVDLALHLDNSAEAKRVRVLARGQPWYRVRLPRGLRPLMVLHGLARRTLRRNGDALLDGPRAMLLAMRLGFLGR